MKQESTKPGKVLASDISTSQSVKKALPNIKLEYLPPEGLGEGREGAREDFDDLLRRAAKPKN